MPEEAAAEPSPLEQFMAVATELGGLDDGPAPAAPAPAKEEPAAPAKQPAIAAAVDDGEAAKEAEKAKQGAPKPGDWAAIREEKRQHRAAVARKQAELDARDAAISAKAKELETYSPAKLKELLHSARLDDLAQLLGAKNWTEVNDIGAKAYADPAYRENQALKEEVKRIAAEREEEKRLQAERQAEYQRQQSEREFIAFVDTECKAATDPVVKALAAAPEFTQAVYGHLVQHYRETGEQMDVAEAAQVIADGARRRYAEWNKVFGSQPTDNQAEAAQAVTPDRAGSKQPARPTKHVARNRAAEAANPTRELTHQEQIATWKGELEKALAEDLKNGTFG